MHLGRFHQTIDLLALDYQAIKADEKIQSIIDGLNNIVTTPSNTEIAQSFKTQLELCREALEKSKLNNPRPIQKTILISIGAEPLIGNELFKKILAAISNNQATPSLAIVELNSLLKNLTTYFTHIKSINRAFAALNVEYEDLEKGESEIGLLIPRIESESTLKALSKEINQWSLALSPIAEIFDNGARPIYVKSCATTDWMFYLSATPPILFGLSFCLKRVNIILKDLIESKKLIAELIKRDSSQEAISILERENDEKLQKKLQESSNQIVDEYYKPDDDGRKNELKTALSQSLQIIARKLSDGAKFELRLIPPEKIETVDPQQGTDEVDEVKTVDINQSLSELAQTLDNEMDLISFDEDSSTLQNLLGKDE